MVVQQLRLLPHDWISELLMTSSDGQRYETIGNSPIAAYAAGTPATAAECSPGCYG